uniref:Uncharacterized protein n=1 Tax=Anguilla anguilla TaxID=7936 RepID=A0A0E9XNY9_ANGAN
MVQQIIAQHCNKNLVHLYLQDTGGVQLAYS